MAALALIAGAWLTRPWWRRADVRALDRKSANVVAYRTRLAEIHAERASGLIDAEVAAQLEQELGARLLGDARDDSAAPAAPAAPSYLTALIVVLALSLFGGGFYAWQGSWRAHGQIETARNDPEAGQQLSVDAMVQRLEDRLKDQPDDAQGWSMLGRSYFVLERYADSARAYARANELTGASDPDLLVAEGEALGLSRDRDLLGRPQQLFALALEQSAEHAKALWYAGLAAAQSDDYAAAQKHWSTLARLPDLPEQLRQALDSRLAELAKITGAPAPQATPPPAASGPVLDVRVSLAPALAGKTPPGQTLFVFAKAASGPPMPLAVQRVASPELPLSVRLDESMAMMPQLKLSAFERWVVSARLGAGDVKAASGDWEGSVDVSPADAARPITLVIDRVVP